MYEQYDPKKPNKYTDLHYRFGIADVDKAPTIGGALISNCVSIMT